MNQSFSTPQFYHSEMCLACPSTPCGQKPTVTLDVKSIATPLFFSNHCSIVGLNNSKIIEEDVDQAHMDRIPATEFTLKRRQYNSEAETPTRKFSLRDFPAPPFSFPASRNQTSSSNPHKSSPNSNNILPFKLRQSSKNSIERRHIAFHARCA
mmetsp:Transcript_6403/g.11705  ORF Transcript_6403/g.11705 Transcript_6403/m.11705 type:complete len:153 (-) Transcript_6403:80-538(-)|eukprot:CAMPEP_0201622426 /NCGR_PEP_ID=MMETSP0492-20130828/47397_1 /ASSEMBLY_ACC=CAM_ASM_000837 /TAXON_ID=420259 /ORGANISM="Thalassiosira gravida, Strain GMp14c1" /LENGTH=152 /DNA_ID=CAMNT_0048092009 /DNA_START=215 /DNA_END=673 /DNA_ORIENTATION=+